MASKQLAAFISFFFTTDSIYMQNLCIYERSTIHMIQKINWNGLMLLTEY